MKIKNFLLFLILTLVSPYISLAQDTVNISGNAPEYSGYQVNLYRYADAVSRNKILVNSFKIGVDGSFESTFNLNTTTYCFAEFDIYRASIYLSPGKSYQLIFPPVKKVPEAQKRSQFFKAEEISFALKNTSPSELNRQIQEFELAYMKEESHYFNQIYRQKSSTAVDSLKSHLQWLFPKTKNTYFEDYRFYRTASAEFALNQGQSAEFVKTHFIDHQPDLLIPPCSKLFNQLFSNYFNFEGNSIRGNNFKILVGRADLAGVENYLMTNNGWNANLSRLVILQSINDAYFQKQYSPQSLIRLLDKISASDWNSDQKTIANRLKDKLTYLEAGSLAPEITMTDFNGKKHYLSEFEDKFIYLTFTRVSNPICRQHLDQLKKMDPSLTDQLHIINLIFTEEANKQELIAQQNWPGTFYIVDNNAADTYRVLSFPRAYLIDEKGKLVLSPAPNPLDGFEQRFINLLKQKRMEKLRNQAK